MRALLNRYGDLFVEILEGVHDALQMEEHGVQTRVPGIKPVREVRETELVQTRPLGEVVDNRFGHSGSLALRGQA